jgi:hypothetical protein
MNEGDEEKFEDYDNWNPKGRESIQRCFDSWKKNG